MFFSAIMNQKIYMLAVLAGVLLSSAVLATPSLKAASAQDNQTSSMNQTKGTKGLPVDTWILVLKQKNPVLEKIEQSQEVKDAIGKIREMKDPREAMEAFNALGALQQLMDIKSAQEAQGQ